MTVCPACGRSTTRQPARTPLRARLSALGPHWATVADGASRWYIHKLRHAYPDYEWRAERITLYGGNDGAWRIEARRPSTERSVEGHESDELAAAVRGHPPNGKRPHNAPGADT